MEFEIMDRIRDLSTGEKRRNQIGGILQLLVVLLLLGILSAISFFVIGFQMSTLIFDVLLTGSLVVVYTDIAKSEAAQSNLQEDVVKIQENQSSILQSQENLMEIEFKPEILREDIELDEDGVEVELQNLGRALAKNLYIRVSFTVHEHVPDEQLTHDSDAFPDDVWIHSEDSVFFRDPVDGKEFVAKLIPLQRKDTAGLLSQSQAGGLLSPSESSKIFSGRVRVGVCHVREPGRTGEILFMDMLDVFSDEGVEEVGFDIDLAFTDLKGNVYVKPLLGKQFNVSDIADLPALEHLGYNSTGTRFEVKEAIEENEIYPPPE